MTSLGNSGPPREVAHRSFCLELIVMMGNNVHIFTITQLQFALPAVDTGAKVPKSGLFLGESQSDGTTLAVELRVHDKFSISE